MGAGAGECWAGWHRCGAVQGHGVVRLPTWLLSEPYWQASRAALLVFVATCDSQQLDLTGSPSAPPTLQIFRAAVDLKLRRLTTECLVLLLPHFGQGATEATGARRLSCCCWRASHGSSRANIYRR